MKKVIVKRKMKFSGALVPYWVIVGTNKDVFSKRYGFDGDICKMHPNGFPISRIEVSELDRIGTRIDNGQTLEIEIADDVTNLFPGRILRYVSKYVVIVPVPPLPSPVFIPPLVLLRL